MTEMNGDGKLKTPLQVEAIEKETRGFDCPVCHTHLQFRVQVRVVGVQETLTGEEAAIRDGAPIPVKKLAKVPATVTVPPEIAAEHLRISRLLHYYEDSGILGAFVDVATELKAHQMPKDTKQFFLNWLKTCIVAPLIPKFALRKLINEFDDGTIEVQHAQGIGAVISNGQLRCFVPMHLLRGEVIRAGGGSNTKLRTMATDAGLDTWIRTKHGYVLGGSAMFTEMKKSAKGNFELTVK